jgi:nicotinate-nucleotide adenylyltransferase
LKRAGIFGGTFDPPHIGHQILAAEAYDQLGLDRVLWVLTPEPPHKLGQAITPLEARLELLRAAVAGDPKFEISRIDIDRPAPHYAVDTMRLFRAALPGMELAYLMGSDSLEDLTSWHKPHEFIALCDWIGVMCRPGYEPELTDLERVMPGIREKVRFVQAPLLEISSSQIRQRIHEGRAFRYYLPERVFNLILQHGLYRAKATVAG